MSFHLTLPPDMTDFAAELLAADFDLTSAPSSLAGSCLSMRERIRELAVCLRAAEEQRFVTSSRSRPATNAATARIARSVPVSEPHSVT